MADYPADTDPEQCRKRVFSGERWDMGGHRCGFKATDTGYCKVHSPNSDDFTAAQTAPPRVTASAEAIFHAELAWEPGDGPVVRVPDRDRAWGYVTRVRAKQTDDGEPDVRAIGVSRKADGTPGIQQWDCTWRAEHLLGEDVMAVITSALRAQGAPEPRDRD